jgi:hypothetical protein
MGITEFRIVEAKNTDSDSKISDVLGYFDDMSILLDGQLLIDEIIFG